MSTPRIVLGSQLPEKSQKLARALFVNRFTRDHRPAWAAYSPRCVVQFASDADWLANTFFGVDSAGNLDRTKRYCESHPTWPDNPELRKN